MPRLSFARSPEYFTDSQDYEYADAQLHASQILETRVREQRLVLAEYSHEPRAELIAYTDSLQNSFREEWVQISKTETCPDIKIFYTKSDQLRNLETKLGTKTELGLGVFHEFSQSVVVVDDIETPSATIARIVNHELAHGYGINQRNLIPYNADEHVEMGDLVTGSTRTGLQIHTEKGSKGNALEEGYAIETEIGRCGWTKYKEQFQLDSAIIQDKINTLAAERLITQVQKKYVLVTKINGQEFSYKIRNTWRAHLLFELVSTELPSFSKLLKEARVTGQQTELQALVDTRFGKGTYKHLMGLSAGDDAQIEKTVFDLFGQN